MQKDKEKAKERLNQLGQEWYALRTGGNEAACQRVVNDVFLLAYELFSSDALAEFFLTDWEKFDPGQRSLYGYMKQRLPLRERSMRREDLGLHRVTVEDEQGQKHKKWVGNGSLDVPVDEQEGGATRGELIADAGAEEPLAEIEMNDSLVQLLDLIHLLPQRLSGRQNNPARLNYFRMFFTDGISAAIQKENGTAIAVYQRHERELFEAMKLSFLDFYTVKTCREVKELSACPVKKHGEMVEGKAMEPIKTRPLPGDVYITYLQKKENYTARASALSMQRAAYTEFMKTCLC